MFKYGWIRVPYLTKEQIEAEGWVENDTEYTKDRWVIIPIYDITVNPYKLILRFKKADVFKKVDKVYFEGECKNINTFRYICKLLGI